MASRPRGLTHVTPSLIHTFPITAPPGGVVRDTPPMSTHDVSEMSSRVVDGEALRIGDLFWPRPDPPLPEERAALLATHLPLGTVAAGITAGWFWSGMGSPTPLCLIAKTQPAPSPLARHRWKIRGIRVAGDHWQDAGQLPVLTLQATWGDLWVADGPNEVAAAQLFCLAEEHPELTMPDGALLNEAGQYRRRLVTDWRERYPWATR